MLQKVTEIHYGDLLECHARPTRLAWWRRGLGYGRALGLFDAKNTPTWRRADWSKANPDWWKDRS